MFLLGVIVLAVFKKECNDFHYLGYERIIHVLFVIFLFILFLFILFINIYLFIFLFEYNQRTVESFILQHIFYKHWETVLGTISVLSIMLFIHCSIVLYIFLLYLICVTLYIYLSTFIGSFFTV